MSAKCKSKSPRLAVILSDLHAGGTTALMPPGFHTREGNEIGLNAVQKWLWDAWEDSWKWFDDLAGGDPWAMVINGDVIDGDHHGTSQIWSRDESDHGIAAYHLLKDHARRATSVYLTQGTESHTHGFESALAYQLHSLGAQVRMPDGYAGAWPTLDLEIAGTYIKADHHIGATTRSYLESSALSIALADMRLRCARAGHRVPRVVIRAHRHQYGYFEDGYGAIVITPCWQQLTRFGHKVVPGAVLQTGLVVLDWRNTGDDCIPHVRRNLFVTEAPSLSQA
jgi:hypothetical protein